MDRTHRFGGPQPIEEWTDEELLEQYRYIKAELADTEPGYRDSGEAPAAVIEDEIQRRGLHPDREDVVPDASSPGREENEPKIRG